MKNKKLIAALFIVAGMISALSGCGGGEEKLPDLPDISAQEVWQAIEGNIDIDKMPAFMDLKASDAEQYYGLSEKELEDFVIKFPMMNTSATEIFIAKISSGNAKAVRSGIEKRLVDLESTWSSYLPDQYALVQDNIIVEKGNWILFSVSEQNSGIEEAFNNALG